MRPGAEIPIAASLPPETVDALFAEFERRRLESESSTTGPWMTAAETAEYLRAPLSRIRKLTMTGELPSEREGRRRLYHRDAIDEFVRNGGAKSP
jgi:excisionase family DNA binding protein